jgi:hypothetical protein
MGLHRIAPPFGGSASVLTPGLCHNRSSAASEIPLHDRHVGRCPQGTSAHRHLSSFPHGQTGTIQA